MKKSDEISEICKALAQAKLEMKSALKDSKNPYFGSEYADYDSLLEAITTALSKYGVVVLQEVTSTEKTVSATTFIGHESGQWFQFDPLSMPLTKADAQAYGSASTYALRYSLRGALGIKAGGDDDAEGNMDRPVKANSAQSKTVLAGPMDRVSLLEVDLMKTIFEKLNDKTLQAKFLKNLKIDQLTKMSKNEYEVAITWLNGKFSDQEKKANSPGN